MTEASKWIAHTNAKLDRTIQASNDTVQVVNELSDMALKAERNIARYHKAFIMVLEHIKRLDQNGSQFYNEVSNLFTSMFARIEELEAEKADRQMIMLSIASLGKNVNYLYERLGIDTPSPLNDYPEKSYSDSDETAIQARTVVTPLSKTPLSKRIDTPVKAHDTPISDTPVNMNDLQALIEQGYSNSRLASHFGKSEATIHRLKRQLKGGQ